MIIAIMDTVTVSVTFSTSTTIASTIVIFIVLRRVSARKWRPLQCSRSVVTLARGASSKFRAEVTTLTVFVAACRCAGRWSVLEILRGSTVFTVLPVRRRAAAWSIFEIPRGSDDSYSVAGVSLQKKRFVPFSLRVATILVFAGRRRIVLWSGVARNAICCTADVVASVLFFFVSVCVCVCVCNTCKDYAHRRVRPQNN